MESGTAQGTRVHQCAVLDSAKLGYQFAYFENYHAFGTKYADWYPILVDSGTSQHILIVVAHLPMKGRCIGNFGVRSPFSNMKLVELGPILMLLALEGYLVQFS